MRHYLKAEQLYDIRGDFSPVCGEIAHRDGSYVFTSTEYTVKTEIVKHPSGVFRRKDTFCNTSDRPLTLYTALSKFTEDGSDFDVYTQRSEWCDESVGAWQNLHTSVSVQNDDLRLNCGGAPFLALFDRQRGSGTAYHLLADGLWQMKAARRFVVDTHTAEVVVEMGISERGFRATVAPGESLTLPTVLYYTFDNRLDMDAYKLHRYCNDIYPARRMPVLYNTWMYRFGNLDFDEMLVQIDRAAALGVEYFVLDAGWFGRGRNDHPGFGSWYEATDFALMGRMTELFARVREKGMHPGVWFEIEGASVFSEAYLAHPEFYFLEKGRAFLNFADPGAVDYIFRILSDRITRYGIECIKFDYNVVPDYDPESASFQKYFEGYRTFMHRLRESHPDLHLECCAGGGLRMAIKNLESFDTFWMSDNHSLHAQLDIFKNTLIRMPARALDHWVTVEGTEHFRENFDGERAPLLYCCGNATWSALESIREDFLLHGMKGGAIGFSCDLTAIPKEIFEKIGKTVAEYKAEGEFWKNSECRILADDERALVLQFNDSKFSTVKIYAFGRAKHQKNVTVRPILSDGKYHDPVTLPLDGVNSASSVTLAI